MKRLTKKIFEQLFKQGEALKLLSPLNKQPFTEGERQIEAVKEENDLYQPKFQFSKFDFIPKALSPFQYKYRSPHLSYIPKYGFWWANKKIVDELSKNEEFKEQVINRLRKNDLFVDKVASEAASEIVQKHQVDIDSVTYYKFKNSKNKAGESKDDKGQAGSDKDAGSGASFFKGNYGYITTIATIVLAPGFLDWLEYQFMSNDDLERLAIAKDQDALNRLIFRANANILQFFRWSDQEDAQYRLGEFFERKKNFSEAIKWYEKAANGCIFSADDYILVDYPFEGWLLEKSIVEGKTHLDAQWRLGQIYQRNTEYKNYEKAVQLYKEAGKNGHAEALKDLAYLYEKGRGVLEKNFKVASTLYEWTAVVGENPSAPNYLASLYRKGAGVPVDLEIRAELYRESAKRGNAAAYYNLGLVYEEGIGVFQDADIAKKYFKKSAEMGEADGLYALGLLYEEKDPVEAVTMYKKAASKKEADNQYDKTYSRIHYALGSAYEEGSGIKKNLRKAVEHYQQAAGKYHKAQYALARLYEKGEGIEKNENKARELFNKSAWEGYHRAQNKLGELCEAEGKYDEAKKWYLVSMIQGDAEAINALGMLYETNKLSIPKKYSSAKKEYIREYFLAAWLIDQEIVDKEIAQKYTLPDGLDEQFKYLKSFYEKLKASEGKEISAALFYTAKALYNNSVEEAQEQGDTSKEIINWISELRDENSGTFLKELADNLVTKDPKKALEFYKISQMSGINVYDRAHSLAKKGSIEAFKWLEEEAQKNEPTPQYIIAGCYLSGVPALKFDDWNGKPDLGRAYSLYEQAYINGHGVLRNMRELAKGNRREPLAQNRKETVLNGGEAAKKWLENYKTPREFMEFQDHIKSYEESKEEGKKEAALGPLKKMAKEGYIHAREYLGHNKIAYHMTDIIYDDPEVVGGLHFNAVLRKVELDIEKQKAHNKLLTAVDISSELLRQDLEAPASKLSNVAHNFVTYELVPAEQSQKQELGAIITEVFNMHQCAQPSKGLLSGFKAQYAEKQHNSENTFTYIEKLSLVKSEKVELAEHNPDVIIDEKAHAQLLHYAATGTLFPVARIALDHGTQLITHRDLLDVHHERAVTLSDQVVMDEKMEAQARFFAQEGVVFDTLREAVDTGRAHLIDDVVTEERQEESFFDTLGFLSGLWQNPLEHNPLELLQGLAHDLLHIDINSHFHG